MGALSSIKSPGLWLGFFGSVLLFVGSVASSWLPDSYKYAPFLIDIRMLGHYPGRIILGLGVVVLGVAFFLMRPPRTDKPADDQPWRARLTLLFWTLPLLIAPPIMSRDVYAYLDQGWMVQAGYSPYLTPMGTVGPFQDLTDSFWWHKTVMYPPLALLIEGFVVWLGQEHVVRTMLLMRLPVLVSLAVSAAVLPTIAQRLSSTYRSKERVIWLALLNPISMIHFVGGSHNDSVMLALMLAAVWLATLKLPYRLNFVAGTVLVGLAASVKQPALFIAVVVALIAWRSETLLGRAWRATLAVAIAGVTFALVTLVSGLGYGWVSASGGPSVAATLAPAYILKITLEWLTPWSGGLWGSVITAVFAVATVVILLWVWLRHWTEPLHVAGWGFFVVVALSPSLQPWYLLYSLVFLATIWVSRRRGTVMVGWLTLLVCAQYLQESWRVNMILSMVYVLPIVTLAVWYSWRHWSHRQSPLGLSRGPVQSRESARIH